jgi:hypothetical protein
MDSSVSQLDNVLALDFHCQISTKEQKEDKNKQDSSESMYQNEL